MAYHSIRFIDWLIDDRERERETTWNDVFESSQMFESWTWLFFILFSIPFAMESSYGTIKQYIKKMDFWFDFNWSTVFCVS